MIQFKHLRLIYKVLSMVDILVENYDARPTWLVKSEYTPSTSSEVTPHEDFGSKFLKL